MTNYIKASKIFKNTKGYAVRGKLDRESESHRVRNREIVWEREIEIVRDREWEKKEIWYKRETHTVIGERVWEKESERKRQRKEGNMIQERDRNIVEITVSE